MTKYPEGVGDLKAIEDELASKSPNSPLLPYAIYRLIQAENSVNSQKAGDNSEKQSEVLKTLMKRLEAFVRDYPNSDDADDAMLNLATQEELQTNTKQAIVWYQRLVKDQPKSKSAERAQGALYRLNLTGQPLTLTGPALTGSGTIDVKNYRGQQVVLVVFYATDAPDKHCEEIVPQLRALYQDNKAKGFEIVGVSLDIQKETAQSFTQKNKMTWPQIYQQGPDKIGGLTSPLGNRFGVNSLPIMFLVDKDGKVVEQSATIVEVKEKLTELLKGNSDVAAGKSNKN
jgi:peroxiredoxin